jgi:hypothetical protein
LYTDRLQHRIEQYIFIGVEMKLALADQFSKYGTSSNFFAIREPEPELSTPRVLKPCLSEGYRMIVGSSTFFAILGFGI